jgi:hypothetical protein
MEEYIGPESKTADTVPSSDTWTSEVIVDLTTSPQATTPCSSVISQSSSSLEESDSCKGNE